MEIRGRALFLFLLLAVPAWSESSGWISPVSYLFLNFGGLPLSDWDFSGTPRYNDGSSTTCEVQPFFYTQGLCGGTDAFDRYGIATIDGVELRNNVFANASGVVHNVTAFYFETFEGSNTYSRSTEFITSPIPVSTDETATMTTGSSTYDYGEPWAGSRTIGPGYICVGFKSNTNNVVKVSVDHMQYRVHYTPATCAALRAPSDAELESCPDGGSYSSGDECTMRCQAGYRRASGNFSSPCRATGETTAAYAPASLVCEPIVCPAGRMLNASFPETPHLTNSVVGTCVAGHNLDGAPPTFNCDGSGNWVGGSGNACVPDVCPLSVPTATPPNAERTFYSGYNTYGARVEFTCNSGYTSSTAGVRQCDVGGVWNGTEINCVYTGVLTSVRVVASLGPSKTLPASLGGYAAVEVSTGTHSIVFDVFDDVGNPRRANLEPVDVSLVVYNTSVSPATAVMDRLGAVQTTVTADVVGTTRLAADVVAERPGYFVFLISIPGRVFWHNVSHVAVGPFHPPATLLSGSGIGGTSSAGAASVLVVTARDFFGNARPSGGDGPFMVEFELDGVVVLTVSSFDDQGSGSYVASYTLTIAGDYVVRVTAAGEAATATFSQTVAPLTIVDPGQTGITGYEECVADVAGCSFLYASRDQYGNIIDVDPGLIEFTYAAGGGVAQPGTVTSALGTRTMSYVVQTAGPVVLHVTKDGSPIPGSPFVAEVVAGAAAASQSFIHGPGAQTSFPRENMAVHVRMRDQFGNNVTRGGHAIAVRILRASWIYLDVEDHGNGTYTANYTGVDTPGTMIMEAYYGADLLGNTPKSVDVVGRCEAGSYAVTPVGPCKLCPRGSFSPGGNSLECTPCPDNTITYGSGVTVADCTCIKGYFAPSPANAQLCELCPEGAACEGDVARPVAKPGFFPAGDTDAVFIACPNEDACLGDGACEEGYEGYLCARCSDDFYTFGNECRRCVMDTGILIFFFVVAIFAAVGALVVMNTFDRSGDNRFTSLIIGLNSLQVTALFAEMDVNWPPVAETILRIFSVLNFNIELSSPECSLAAENFFLLKHYFFMTLPIALAIFFCMWAALLSLRYTYLVKNGERFKRKHPGFCTPPGKGATYFSYFKYNVSKMFWSAELNPRGLRHAAIRAYYQILVVVYMPLAGQSLAYFPCSDDESGTSVMTFSPATPCGDAAYNRHLVPAVVFSFLYCVGIPLFVVAVLVYKRRRMDAIKFELRYGFLISRYVERLFFWEAVIMVRKFAVVMALLFFDNTYNLELFLACGTLLVALFVHQRMQPFRRRTHNQLEYVAILTSALVLFLAMAFANLKTRWLLDVFLVMSLLFNVVCVTRAFVLDMRGMYEDLQEGLRDANETGDFGGTSDFIGVAPAKSYAIQSEREEPHLDRNASQLELMEKRSEPNISSQGSNPSVVEPPPPLAPAPPPPRPQARKATMDN